MLELLKVGDFDDGNAFSQSPQISKNPFLSVHDTGLQ